MIEKSVNELMKTIERGYYWSKPIDPNLAETIWNAYKNLNSRVEVEGNNISFITNTIMVSSVRFMVNGKPSKFICTGTYDKEGFVIHVASGAEREYDTMRHW